MERTGCCVAGGGPAGVMLGLLLARAGVDVVVLEKHPDFLRDFRGDTVHASTIRLLDELGLGERFAALPAGRLTRMQMQIGEQKVTVADFGKTPGRYKFMAMVPQSDFLGLIAEAGAAEPRFSLRMGCEVTGLLREGERVTGVRYRDADGETRDVSAPLTVGCDGRWSVVRQEAGLAVEDFPVPNDVWQVRVEKAGPGRDRQIFARFGHGQAALTVDRGDYYQTAYLIPKGADDALRQEPVQGFRDRLGELFGWGSEQLAGIRSWDDVKTLHVRMGRMAAWHGDGVLCIGDAAHPMSPAGGTGVNLAVQDAVATATALAGPLRAGVVLPHQLAAVRRRRQFAVVATHAAQHGEHSMLVEPALAGRLAEPPRAMRVIDRLWRVPLISTALAYLAGYGFRPEHVPAFARRPPLPAREPGAQAAG